ncbi:MAG: hypothetical protein JRJ38_19785 [Deltaproteobacteria bacterium]|nr:hypothetical protein [Deltaproteobacteria bacterium]
MKTSVIVETLQRNAKARILLASQTHIAIDNALERLSEHGADIPIVRIAREQSSAVSESSMPFLLNHQMWVWRKEVIERSTAGLEKWASKQGLDSKDIRIGTLIRQLLAVRERIERSRKRTEEEDGRRKELNKQKTNMPNQQFDIEYESVSKELQELRDQLDSDKKQLNSLKDQIKTVRPDAAELLDLSVSELGEWAGVLLGEKQHVERLLRLQSEWVDRFGVVRDFVRPLIERSAVVAATCVGLATIGEAKDVEYDLCIIDEASKATAMESCVPMARAKRWILVGDSRQLPPFQEEVLSRQDLREQYDLQAADAGQSMFERFRRLLPDSNRVMLTMQYRMVEPIGRLISDCFYDGRYERKRRLASILLTPKIDQIFCPAGPIR